MTDLRPLRHVVAIRHVHFEDLGTFAAVLQRRGARIRFIDAGREPIDRREVLEADLTVALGAPVAVYDGARYPWIEAELRALEARVKLDSPTLGICLGAQMIAHALGARVYPGPAREIGWAPLMLTTAGRAGPFAALAGAPMFHWHGDTFDLPRGATRLASTSSYENQAFAWGRAVAAFQCHPELDADRIEEWLIGHASELAHARVDPDELRQQTVRHGAALAEVAPAVFGAWLDGIFVPPLTTGTRGRCSCRTSPNRPLRVAR